MYTIYVYEANTTSMALTHLKIYKSITYTYSEEWSYPISVFPIGRPTEIRRSYNFVVGDKSIFVTETNQRINERLFEAYILSLN